MLKHKHILENGRRDDLKRTTLLVIPWSSRLKGGVSVVVRNLAEHLRTKNSAAHHVISDWDAPKAYTDSFGEEHFRLAIMGEPDTIKIIKDIIFAPIRLLKIQKYLNAGRFTVVNFHYPGQDALGVALLKRLKLFRGKLILSFHGTDVRNPSNSIKRWIWRFILDSADQITACSESLSHQVITELQIPANKTHVLLSGFDRKTFYLNSKNSREGLFLKKLPDRYFASIGSFTKIKGHSTLLDAFAIFAASNQDVSLVICGMNGPEKDALQERAIQFRLNERVILLVDLEPSAVAEVMRNAIAIVQPSTREAFGLAVVEAGACGKLVIASDVGGHREILSDGKTGLLFPPNDHQVLSQLLLYAILNSDATREIARSLHTRVDETYSWQKCAESFLEISR